MKLSYSSVKNSNSCLDDTERPPLYPGPQQTNLSVDNNPSQSQPRHTIKKLSENLKLESKVPKLSRFRSQITLQTNNKVVSHRKANFTIIN